MVDEPLEIDPAGSRHMFWEEVKRLFFASREIKPENLHDEKMKDFFKTMDEVSHVLQRIEKKQRERERKT